MTPAKLVASLPDKIRVGPYDIALRPMTLGRASCTSSYGRNSTIEKAIYIQEDFATSQHAADILIHEINHALWDVFKLQDADGEERTVAALATGWAQVYRDNPWLLGWLKKALR